LPHGQDLVQQIDPLLQVTPRNGDFTLALTRRPRFEPEVDLVMETLTFGRKLLFLGFQQRQFVTEILEICIFHAAHIGRNTTGAKPGA
jgi:hypothetical protein